MKRSVFLKDIFLFSVGGVLMPSLLLESCRKNTDLNNIKFSGKVVIIGAGAAGLYAAYLLRSKNIDCTILEASGTHGGRMGKHIGFADYDIDTGAQWLHGQNSIVGDMIRQKHIAFTQDDSALSYWFGNNIVDSLPSDPFIFESADMPDISFKDYAHQKGFSAGYDYIIEAIAGDQGASASLLSAYGNNKDEENWVAGNEDYKFKRTYFDAINDTIAAGIVSAIAYNSSVISIDHSGQKVILKTADNKTYEADKVIITVPISILKAGDITFKPALPQQKTEAFAKIGMGPGMKVFLKFSESFYRDNLYGGPVCAAYVNDAVGKATNNNVLLAFVMGDQAATLTALGSDDAIIKRLLDELDIIYKGKASATFIAGKVFDYTSHPFIRGAYSYATIGMGDARTVAAQSIDNKLFFAGEAMNINGHHQTVHGAVETGYQAVMEILKNS